MSSVNPIFPPTESNSQSLGFRRQFQLSASSSNESSGESDDEQGDEAELDDEQGDESESDDPSSNPSPAKSPPKKLPIIDDSDLSDDEPISQHVISKKVNSLQPQPANPKKQQPNLGSSQPNSSKKQPSPTVNNAPSGKSKETSTKSKPSNTTSQNNQTSKRKHEQDPKTPKTKNSKKRKGYYTPTEEELNRVTLYKAYQSIRTNATKENSNKSNKQ